LVTSKLTTSYHQGVIEAMEQLLLWSCWIGGGTAEDGMKVYLLMLLIGSLLTAIHFTSAPEQRSKSLSQ
jgi:hypothetical protein